MDSRKSSPPPLPSGSSNGGSVLLVVAAPAEFAAVARALGLDSTPAEPWRPVSTNRDRGGLEVVLSGIGKSNAAGAAARFLNASMHRAVISVGIAGTLDPVRVPIGSVIAASSSIFADEGLLTPSGFQDCDQMGFPIGAFPGSAPPSDASLLQHLGRHADLTGVVATVSTCSGTDELAAAVRSRTAAVAEAMEGAAVGVVAHRLGVPFAELRVISNTTGDRPRQEWRIREAFDRLGEVIGQMF